jgi:Putative DNA-binding domain
MPFAESLLDEQQIIPEGIICREGANLSKRYAIYKNNVMISLIAALRTRFPVTEILLGEDYFKQSAAHWIRSNPPSSPLLMFYGDSFPSYLDIQDDLRDMPYMGDVARIECAITHAFHAEDKNPLPTEEISTIGEEALLSSRLFLHPSTQMCASNHPAFSIWSAHKSNAEPQPPENWISEETIIVRPYDTVEVLSVPIGTISVLKAIKLGSTLLEALEQAEYPHQSDTLSSILVTLFSNNLICEIKP